MEVINGTFPSDSHRVNEFHLFCSDLLYSLFCFSGGFMFKQWKEKYVVLTVGGSLLVCKDADSPPDQVVVLQSNCQSIVGGREILDLPHLPPGGRRDCCFALILPQDKFLLLLSDDPDDCRSVWTFRRVFYCLLFTLVI